MQPACGKGGSRQVAKGKGGPRELSKGKGGPRKLANGKGGNMSHLISESGEPASMMRRRIGKGGQTPRHAPKGKVAAWGDVSQLISDDSDSDAENVNVTGNMSHLVTGDVSALISSDSDVSYIETTGSRGYSYPMTPTGSKSEPRRRRRNLAWTKPEGLPPQRPQQSRSQEMRPPPQQKQPWQQLLQQKQQHQVQQKDQWQQQQEQWKNYEPDVPRPLPQQKAPQQKTVTLDLTSQQQTLLTHQNVPRPLPQRRSERDALARAQEIIQQQKIANEPLQAAEVPLPKEPPLTSENSTIRGTRAPVDERLKIQLPKEARRLVAWVLAITVMVVLVMAFAPSEEEPVDTLASSGARGSTGVLSNDGSKGWALASEGHRSRTMHHKRAAQERQRQRHKKKYKNRSSQQRNKRKGARQ
jgi:hypothetical protein